MGDNDLCVGIGWGMGVVFWALRCFLIGVLGVVFYKRLFSKKCYFYLVV